MKRNFISRLLKNVIKVADCLAKTDDASEAQQTAIRRLTRGARRLRRVKSGVYA
jgi:hypothetical protein